MEGVNEMNSENTEIRRLLADIVKQEADRTKRDIIRAMRKQLRNLSDSMRKSHENEREILSWVSDEPEKHQPKDGRRISTVKRNMTYVAAHAIFNAKPDSATKIGMRFFNTFKAMPGAYDNFESFMRQVRRMLIDLRT